MRPITLHLLRDILAMLAGALVCAGIAMATETQSSPELPFSEGTEQAPRVNGLTVEDVDLGLASNDHVRSLVSEVTETGQTGMIRLQLDKPAPAAQDTLFYDRSEVEQRAAALRARISTLLGKNAPDEKTSEERELELQQEIELDKSYESAGKGHAQSGNGNHAQSKGKPGTVKLRLLELAFIVWDFITHPLTIFIVVTAGLIRLTVAIYRISGDKSKRRHSHRKSKRTQQFAPVTEYEKREERRRQRHYSTRRKSHRRRSWLSRIGSA